MRKCDSYKSVTCDEKLINFARERETRQNHKNSRFILSLQFLRRAAASMTRTASTDDASVRLGLCRLRADTASRRRVPSTSSATSMHNAKMPFAR